MMAKAEENIMNAGIATEEQRGQSLNVKLERRRSAQSMKEEV